MTRTLPWLKRSSTATPQAKRAPPNAAPRAKRRRVLESSSDVEDENGDGRARTVSRGRTVSPPPDLELPSQSLMEEGFDKDDRFRMVEDEFLDAAKQFTQHLHAAEYQRLKKAARSQNAAAINSISRPVTIKMPDETRRKVESVVRAKKQAVAIRSVLGKQSHGSESDENSDANGGAWLGTALHGLMESPRRSATSLTKVGKATASTRAAAGFDKPRPRSLFNRPPSPLPRLESFELLSAKHRPQNRFPSLSHDNGDGYGDDDDDDDDGYDLDAPIRFRTQYTLDEPTKLTVGPSAHALSQNFSKNSSKPSMDVSFKASSFGVLEDDISTSSRISVSARERITKRLERAKLRQVTEDQEPQKHLEIIPLFLS